MTDVLGALDVREATVVVQDWGGPIGLRWAVENADRVAALAIFNTGLPLSCRGGTSRRLLRSRTWTRYFPTLGRGRCCAISFRRWPNKSRSKAHRISCRKIAGSD